MRLRKLFTAAIAASALVAGMAIAPAYAATEVKMILWPTTLDKARRMESL
jgi:hypothetical protein